MGYFDKWTGGQKAKNLDCKVVLSQTCHGELFQIGQIRYQIRSGVFQFGQIRYQIRSNLKKRDIG